jgi:hypothetical protein
MRLAIDRLFRSSPAPATATFFLMVADEIFRTFHDIESSRNPSAAPQPCYITLMSRGL